jgi:hypothetical protein
MLLQLNYIEAIVIVVHVTHETPSTIVVTKD